MGKKKTRLCCSVCLYVPVKGKKYARRAVTVKGGEAVCDDHLSLPHSETVNLAIRLRHEGSL